MSEIHGHDSAREVRKPSVEEQTLEQLRENSALASNSAIGFEPKENPYAKKTKKQFRSQLEEIKKDEMRDKDDKRERDVQ